MNHACPGGRRVRSGPVGTPEGPAHVMDTPGGATVALLRVDRPEAMETAFADEADSHRVVP